MVWPQTLDKVVFFHVECWRAINGDACWLEGFYGIQIDSSLLHLHSQLFRFHTMFCLFCFFIDCLCIHRTDPVCCLFQVNEWTLSQWHLVAYHRPSSSVFLNVSLLICRININKEKNWIFLPVPVTYSWLTLALLEGWPYCWRPPVAARSGVTVLLSHYLKPIFLSI